MHYFANLNPTTRICDSILQIDDATYDENANNGYTYVSDTCIAIDSYDESLINRKKYIDGEWVDALASETTLIRDTQLVHVFGSDDKFLSDALGELSTLSTISKTSLVSAINEVFQSASDGKTAIANAITGVDSSLTIPENPTFTQLASLIGQMGLHIEMGTMSEYTIPSLIEGTTSFRPKIIIVYNFGSGLSNFNMGVYVSPTVTEVTTQQISDSANGIGGTLSRRANAFTVTDNGFSMINTGAVTNLKWIAIG